MHDRLDVVVRDVREQIYLQILIFTKAAETYWRLAKEELVRGLNRFYTYALYWHYNKSFRT